MKDDAYIHLALLAKHQSELTKRFIEIEKKIDEILDQDNRKNEANTNRDRIIHKKKNNKKTSTPMSFSNNKVSESIEEIEDDDESKSSKNDNNKDINDEDKVDGDINADIKDIQMNANKNNKDNSKSIYKLPKDSENIFNVKRNKIMSTNLDGENKYCVLFDEKCDIPYTDLETSTITIRIIKPCDYLIFGICDSSLKDNIG